MNEEPNRMSINGNLQNTMQHSKYANSQQEDETANKVFTIKRICIHTNIEFGDSSKISDVRCSDI